MALQPFYHQFVETCVVFFHLVGDNIMVVKIFQYFSLRITTRELR